MAPFFTLCQMKKTGHSRWPIIHVAEGISTPTGLLVPLLDQAQIQGGSELPCFRMLSCKALKCRENASENIWIFKFFGADPLRAYCAHTVVWAHPVMSRPPLPKFLDPPLAPWTTAHCHPPVSAKILPRPENVG